MLRNRLVTKAPGLAGRLRDARLLLVVAAVPLLLLNLVLIPETRAALPVYLGVFFLAVQLGLLARSRGVSISGYLRMVVAGCLWAVVIFASQLPIMAVTGWDSSSDEASVWIAGPTEEILKLVPLLAVLVFARNRAARFGIVDHILLGAACGSGFGLTENSVRGLVQSTSVGFWETFSDLPDVAIHEYSLLTLFPGWQDSGGVESAGHAVFTALVAAGIGLVRRYRTVLLWPLPALLLAWATLDHMVWNDQAGLGGSLLPEQARLLHEALGSGALLRPLLLTLIVLAIWLDYRALSKVYGQLPPIPPKGSSQGASPLSAVLTILAELRFQARITWRAPRLLPSAMAFVRSRRELGYGLYHAAGAPRRDAPSARLMWQLGAALHNTITVVAVFSAVVLLSTLAEAVTGSPESMAAFIAATFDGIANFWNGLSPAEQGLITAGGTAALMMIPGVGLVSALTWTSATTGLVSSWDDIKSTARERGPTAALGTAIMAGAAAFLFKGKIRLRGPGPSRPPADRRPGTLRDFQNRNQDEVLPQSQRYMERLSDEQLLREANDPTDDPFGMMIDSKNNKIDNGNHRARELMRRADDPNSSITWDDVIYINWT